MILVFARHTIMVTVTVPGGGGVRATLNDLTIANGSAFGVGGIFNGGTLTVTGSTLSGNRFSMEGGDCLGFPTDNGAARRDSCRR